MKLLKLVTTCCFMLSSLFLMSSPVIGMTNDDNQHEFHFVINQLQEFSENLRPLVLEKEENVIYSPLSYYLALLSLEPGLTNEQQELMMDALMPDSDKIDREEYLDLVASFLTKATEGETPTFLTKSYLLGNQNKKWHAEFESAVKNLATFLKLVDFTDPATYEALNKDIAQFTNDLINPYFTEDRIEELINNEALYLMVLNMLYFKGEWTNTFEETLTEEAPFYGRAEESTVDLMSQTNYFDYYETDDYQAVRLNYTNDANFIVVLPKEAVASDIMWEFYDDVNDNDDIEWESKRIKLSLPKWEESASLELTESLQYLGLDSFAKDLGDTTYFTTEAEVFISQILQRVEFKLDENGTEAAAVTELIMETKAIMDEHEPIEMIVNRPFVYNISLDGLPLFEGSVQNLSK